MRGVSFVSHDQLTSAGNPWVMSENAKRATKLGAGAVLAALVLVGAVLALAFDSPGVPRLRPIQIGDDPETGEDPSPRATDSKDAKERPRPNGHPDGKAVSDDPGRDGGESRGRGSSSGRPVEAPDESPRAGGRAPDDGVPSGSGSAGHGGGRDGSGSSGGGGDDRGEGERDD